VHELQYDSAGSPSGGCPPVDLDKISLASAIEQAVDAIVITDATGKIRYVNPAFTRMTGYCAAEAIGQNPRIVKSGTQDSRFYKELWKTILDGRAWHGELINRRKDGTRYTEEMTITPVRDGSGTISSFIAIKQDVTERRAAEAALRASEERYRSLFENMREGYASCKMLFENKQPHDFLYLAVNSAFESVTGLKGVAGRKASEVIPGLFQSNPELLEIYARVTLTGRPEKFEIGVHPLERWFSISAYSIGNDCFGASFENITERKRADRLLHLTQACMDKAPLSVMWLDPDSSIAYANDTACQTLGYSRQELLSLSILDLDPDLTEDLYRATWGRLTAAGSLSLESRRRRKDREIIPVEISASHIEFDGSEFSCSFSRDITQRKQAEESARRAEEKYRRLIANLPDVTWTSDNSGRVTYISPNVKAILGYTSGETLGADRSLWISRIHPADSARVEEAVRALFEAGRPFDMEYQFQRRDGQWIWLHDRTAPTCEQDGSLFAAGVFSDVTTRKHAEAALAESEERYRLLFLRNLAGVFRALPDGRSLDCNAAFLRILGHQSAAEFQMGTVSDIFYDAGEQRSALDHLFKAGSVVNTDLRLKRKSGEPIWVLANIGLIEDENGHPVSIEGTVVDITDRKRAEQALQENELKYRTLVANIPDVLWTADAGGDRVFVSPKCEITYGYTPQELCQPDAWSRLVHPEDRQRVQEAYAELLTDARPYNVVYRLRRNDGQFIWIHDRAVNSYERAGNRYVDGCFSDITEQKVNAKLMELLQLRSELILQCAGEGILGLDTDGNFTFANLAAARMLGCDSSGLIGQDMHELVRHAHADGTPYPRIECGILGAMRDGKEHRETGDMFWSADGRYFPVEFVSTPKVENGQLVGSVVVFRDITEAAHAQQRIEASLKEKDALLREIHHRVKNNLQIVCSLLKLNSRNLKDPEARHVIEDTQHRVKAMALVHETLYRSGDLAGINFSEYVPRLAEQLLHAYGLSSRRVRIAYDVESVVLPIDIAIPCALMLTELISNSAKHVFVAEGRGDLRIVFRRFSEESWLLKVEDSGLGAAPESTPVQGSSFGLELVRLLTEQLSGAVQMDRKPGFCVSVVFPLVGEK